MSYSKDITDGTCADPANIERRKELESISNPAGLVGVEEFEAPYFGKGLGERAAHLIDFSAVKDAIENGVTPDASFLKPATEANKAIDELAEQMAMPLVGKAEVGQLYSYEAPAASNDFTTEVEPEPEIAACACDTCLEEAGLEIEEADNVPCDTDADGLQMALEMIADLKARFEALEERITLFNVRSSHKL